MPRRVLQGTVRSTANDKTVVVEVERRFRHPLYGKFVKEPYSHINILEYPKLLSIFIASLVLCPVEQ